MFGLIGFVCGVKVQFSSQAFFEPFTEETDEAEESRSVFELFPLLPRGADDGRPDFGVLYLDRTT